MWFHVLFIFSSWCKSQSRSQTNSQLRCLTWSSHASILHLWSRTNHFMSLLASHPLPTSSEIAIPLRQRDEWQCRGQTILLLNNPQCYRASAESVLGFLLLTLISEEPLGMRSFICKWIHFTKIYWAVCYSWWCDNKQTDIVVSSYSLLSSGS